jgi:hypothetical protein
MRARHPCGRDGQSILEIVIYMVILGVISLAGSIGYSVYLQDANGSACTVQLNRLDVAEKAYCVIHNVTLTANIPTYAGGTDTSELEAFLGNLTINSTQTNGFACPAGGTYLAPTSFVAGTTEPVYPTCSLSTNPQFVGTRFHSITTL